MQPVYTQMWPLKTSAATLLVVWNDDLKERTSNELLFDLVKLRGLESSPTE